MAAQSSVTDAELENWFKTEFSIPLAMDVTHSVRPFRVSESRIMSLYYKEDFFGYLHFEIFAACASKYKVSVSAYNLQDALRLFIETVRSYHMLNPTFISMIKNVAV
jgi:hypothetical protein